MAIGFPGCAPRCNPLQPSNLRPGAGRASHYAVPDRFWTVFVRGESRTHYFCDFWQLPLRGYGRATLETMAHTRNRNTPRKPPQTAGEAALRADRRTLAELSRILGMSKMTISRWSRDVDIPDEINTLLLQTRLGIPVGLWLVVPDGAPEAAPAPAPVLAALTTAPTLKPATTALTEPPAPPEPPHAEGPHRLPGEDFGDAVARRAAWRGEWQAAWVASWRPSLAAPPPTPDVAPDPHQQALDRYYDALRAHGTTPLNEAECRELVWPALAARQAGYEPTDPTLPSDAAS